jgi:hypothetical protein
MSRTCIFLAMLTMAQVKAVEITFYLKTHGAAQTRTKMISHQNSLHGQWVKTHNAHSWGGETLLILYHFR